MIIKATVKALGKVKTRHFEGKDKYYLPMFIEEELNKEEVEYIKLSKG